MSKAFDPNKYVTKDMSLDAVLKLKECFDVFDVDKGGSISIDELLIVIEGCGLKEKEAQILGIINSSRHTGDINFQTFLEIFGFHEDHNSEASLQQIFEVFDPTNSGAFGPLEFENVARQIGEHFSTAQVNQMIDYADKDRDGVINFEEFSQVVSKVYPQV